MIPYQEIARAIKHQKLIPVLGAGASISSEPWRTFDDTTRVDGYPLSYQLAAALCDEIGIQSPIPTLDVAASYYSARTSPVQLRNRLDQTFHVPVTPKPIHRLLARCDLPIIITTNYDELMETALRNESKPYEVVYYSCELPDRRLGAPLQRRNFARQKHYEQITAAGLIPSLIDPSVTTVFKIHGTSTRSYICSVEQYTILHADLLRGRVLAPRLSVHLHNRAFLYLGYSFSDWSIRSLHFDYRIPGRLRSLERSQTNSFLVSHTEGFGVDVEEDVWRVRRCIFCYSSLDAFAASLGAALDRTQ